jgi:hypothetical protein
MKVVAQKPLGFQPLTITLESQAEVDMIASLLGSCDERLATLFGICKHTQYDSYQQISQYSEQEYALDITQSVF